MANSIIGLDVGGWSVKIVEIDPRDGSLVDFEEIILNSIPSAATEPPAPESPVDTASEPAALPEAFDDAPTQVREAPQSPVAGASSDEKEPVDSDEADAVEPLPLPESNETTWTHAIESLSAYDTVITADRLVAAMPEEETTTLRVPVPFEEPSKIKSVLPHLLEDRLPMPLDSVIWTFTVGPVLSPAPDSEPFEALVAVATKENIAAYLAELKKCAIDPAYLLVPEHALTALESAAWRSGEGPTAILDIGHETSNLIVSQSGTVLVARSIKYAGRKLTDRIADDFGVAFDEAERLKHDYAAVVEGEAPNEQMARLNEAIAQSMRPIVRDVRRTLQSTFARDRIEVDSILLIGGTSAIPGLDRYLTTQLGVAVERFTLETFAGTAAAAARGTMAWSLASVGSDDALRSRALNLRTGEFNFRGRSSYLRAQLLKFGAVAAVFLLLGFGFLLARKTSYEAQRDAMRSALRQETKQLFGQPLTSESKIKERLEGEGAAGQNLIPARSAYELTYEVVKRISSNLDLELTRLEVDVDRNIVQIRGDTSGAQAVDSLVSDLEKHECLKEVKKDRRLTVKGERADFELQFNASCS